MTWNMRPLSVTILAWVYIGVGAIGLFPLHRDPTRGNAFQYDGMLTEVVEVLAIVCGAFMLRGHNRAGWLAIRLDGVRGRRIPMSETAEGPRKRTSCGHSCGRYWSRNDSAFLSY
jgi:hypothetical protein